MWFFRHRVLIGAVGIMGNLVAGRVGDTAGRKRVGGLLLAAFPVMCFALYRGTGATAVFAWAAVVFSFMGGRLMLRALSIELFPTAQRAAAAGAFTFAEALGGVLGLLALHFYRAKDHSAELSFSVPVVACASYAVVLLVLFLPETRHRELEEIA